MEVFESDAHSSQARLQPWLDEEKMFYNWAAHMSASDEMNAWNDSHMVQSGIPPHRIHVPRGLTNAQGNELREVKRGQLLGFSLALNGATLLTPKAINADLWWCSKTWLISFHPHQNPPYSDWTHRQLLDASVLWGVFSLELWRFGRSCFEAVGACIFFDINVI